jgi:acetyl esterase/lipase
MMGAALALAASMLLALAPAAAAAGVPADEGDAALRDIVTLIQGARIDAGLTYLTASGVPLKLDVYTPRPGKQPAPVVLMFHGGGWVKGTRESVGLAVLPWLRMGFAVVNADYRLASTAPAPAAVEDALCALQWVANHAKERGFDTGRIVVTGNSAGAHLALVTGMAPLDTPFANQCAGTDPNWSLPLNVRPKVAAIVNWYGIADVNDLLAGPNTRGFALVWMGSQERREALARQLSPLAMVRRDAPPVLSIHGSADPLVPYAQALKLQQAMNAAGQPNELLTIDGGGHGGFDAEQQWRAFSAVRRFLKSRGLLPLN